MYSGKEGKNASILRLPEFFHVVEGSTGGALCRKIRLLCRRGGRIASVVTVLSHARLADSTDRLLLYRRRSSLRFEQNPRQPVVPPTNDSSVQGRSVQHSAIRDCRREPLTHAQLPRLPPSDPKRERA
jgi:hypothetical protein